MTQGEYTSALSICAIVPDLVPRPVAWGQYHEDDSDVYFIPSVFHTMDLTRESDPDQFAEKLFQLHTKGRSQNGMFGFPVPTALGKFERSVMWTASWAEAFTKQLQDVIGYDNAANPPWPAYHATCTQLSSAVIPRFLGVLQSGGRSIRPSLIHGDLCEQNVGVDEQTGKTVVFDTGSMYAHNEMEFGTWRG
jgi:protein-ribulosamine 3-kinase